MPLFFAPVNNCGVYRSYFTHSSTCFVILPKVKAGLHLPILLWYKFDILEEEERDRIRSQVIYATPNKRVGKGEVMNTKT